MQRSPSLTQAISTAETLLRADTDDLKQLAAIAGQDPREMYLRADLTGVDLTRQDISFLIGLGTNFEAAKLTDEQRRLLRRGSKEERAQETRRSIRDVRVELVLKFIERHLNDDMTIYYSQSELHVPHDWDSETQHALIRQKREALRTQFETTLRSTLLDPILHSSSPNPNDQFGSDYMSAALSRLSMFLSDGSEAFFEELFQLFGDVRCPIDGAVIDTLKQSYRPQLGSRLGNLIAKMRPIRVLDAWWVLDQDGFAAMIAAATEISRRREVHVAAIEAFATEVTDPKISLQMLTEAGYELGGDQAERIAYAIVSRNWPASMTSEILDARVPRPLAIAIFRQLLAQGNGPRISEVILWLDRSRWSLGGLSLENAVANIDDFDAVYNLAKMLAPNERSNQTGILESRMSQLARTDMERAKLNRFRQEYM
ncbi:hypothetical protein [Paracoccus yeei]|jgi:hypothetical protein|uniref:hypothetical protein n=1 Tax=Paracoccus yeei TaxID=147645 RepID=UPI003BF81BFB